MVLDRLRMTMPKLLSVFLISLILGAGCSGDGKSKSGEITISELQIGTDATYPPFEMVDTKSGKPEGFDIDIMKSICRLNGWEARFVIVPFDGIISGLKNDKFNCIISAMTITPERKQNVAFSEPYYQAGQVIAVPLSEQTIHGPDDLKGKKVGVQLGTTGERLAKTMTGVEIISYDNIGAAFIDMENNRLNAVLNDWPTTREYIRLKKAARTVGGLLSEEQYGIAVRIEDTELLDKINQALHALKESGEYDRIARKWFRISDSGH
jgi:polar amino acid transport system substrate-binding protein